MTPEHSTLPGEVDSDNLASVPSIELQPPTPQSSSASGIDHEPQSKLFSPGPPSQSPPATHSQHQLPGTFPDDSHNIDELMASMSLQDRPRRAQLDGIPELNILVLGETGVGKSTFINAFANYIHFDSLDDALDQQALQCVIPSSFTWQSLVDDDYVAGKIHVKPNTGEHLDSQSAQDEKDGAQGQSATQRTKRYTMQVGTTLVRLIDTPGIGDTRGAAQDKKNMDDILATLNTVDVLHGIPILLKPNTARLTVMFTFCLKELLTHLHRDAAKNIVFGFTNARNTSFRPGETYNTLKQMLDKDQSVGIQLGRSTTFCFDSESFRCLAAHHNGTNIHDMGDIDDYRLSWEKSSAETYRMLEHFRPTTTVPHKVMETWDLHRTRELVRILTVPMADITQVINNNIALQKDEQCQLRDAIARGDDLEGVLYLSKVTYEMEKLKKPRTVCSHHDCGEYKDNRKHYKTLCHDPCHLVNVEVDQFPCEALMHCGAFLFNGPDQCSVCGHSWQLHLHVLWQPVEKVVQVEDQAVLQRITENKSGVEVTEQALKSRQHLIHKYEAEKDKIQKAAGQFAVFLKQSSIKPWNDSKLAYLDHLINEEKDKIEAGAPDQRLQDLLADKKQHLEEIRTLTKYTEVGKATKQVLDQQGIKALIDSLYALELTGPNLKQAAQQLEEIQNSTAQTVRQRGEIKATASYSGYGRPSSSRGGASGPIGQSSGSSEGTSSGPRKAGAGRSKVGKVSGLFRFVFGR